MGREFLDIFTGWAESYDETVAGKDDEYKEVFENYDDMLEKIANLSGTSVLEFGSGTGNLTQKLLAHQRKVFPVEPSKEMTEIAKRKPTLRNQLFIEGDLENFPKPSEEIDTIVSSFVFHHLTEAEKNKVIRMYYNLLPKRGKVIIGDTMFLSHENYELVKKESYDSNKLNLLEDLEREYYPLVLDMEVYFREAGFRTKFNQINQFAWIIEAVKN